MIGRMPILAVLIALSLVILWLTAALNLLTFPSLRTATPTGPVGRVSLLVPARNEARVIGRTVTTLLNQAYPDLEVIVLDDDSADNTAALARAAAAGDPRLRVIPGEPLPPGWLGKNWACHQLSRAATGDVLIFTDADVTWERGALNALLAHLRATNADLLTVWPRQETVTWGERLVIPTVALVVLAYLPLVAVHHLPWSIFAAANGQCLAFRRDAYAAAGGHAAVRADIVEDIALARRIKRAGRRLRMAAGGALLHCRMYHSWPEVRDGLAKNIVAGHGGRIMLLLSTAFHWLVFAGPWLWLALGWHSRGWPGVPLALGGAGVLLRAATAAKTGQRVLDAALMPVTVVLMTRIAAQALWWQARGTAQWKGRPVT